MRVTNADYLFRPPTQGLRGLTLPTLFETVAAAAPDAVAATDGTRTWMWRQWQSDSDALAKGLQNKGIQLGDVVAVQLSNGWEFLTAHIAVAAVGAVMLPLHDAYGPADVRALVDRIEPVVIVDSAEWPRLLADGAGGRPHPVTVLPDMPLMAMPSSGTTSAHPKVCLHSHDGLLSNAAAVAENGMVSGSDVLLSASPFTHLFGLGSIHVGLLTGACQALMPGWDADRFVELVAETGASALYAVPTQLYDIVAGLGNRSDIRLRSVYTGGAVVPAALISDVRKALDARVVVVWGMSEVGVGIFTRPDDPDEAASTTLGSPIAGAQVRVMDGELQFRGASMFRGYLHDPERTAAAITGDGWLRTGDLARIDAEGRVVYLCRSSELINVGGRKIVVREIEDLLSHLGRVAMVGRTDVRLGEYPCLVMDKPGVTFAEIVDILRAAGIAEYKWPLELVVVDAIPLTLSGKINRTRVADLVATRDAPWPGAVPMLDLLQVVRSRALRVVDGNELIPPETTFRDYGFDSASALRFRNELAETIGRPLPTSIVFDHPTPRELARYLAEEGETALPTGFEQTYRMLCEVNPHAAADVIRAASMLRSVFTAADAVAAQAIRLASGAGPSVVICFPPMFPMSIPTEFSGFAEAFAGIREVYAVALPGFVDGQALPADVEALAAAHMAAVTELAGDRPYVLCGHSSGGWIAHLVTERLHSRPPAGVVLLDSYWPSPGFVREETPDVLPIAVERERSLGIEEVGMTRLTATGGYLRVLEDWVPAEIATPVLHVAAGIDGATWPLPHVAAVAPGDHISMLLPAGKVVASWVRHLEAHQ